MKHVKQINEIYIPEPIGRTKPAEAIVRITLNDLKTLRKMRVTLDREHHPLADEFYDIVERMNKNSKLATDIFDKE